jgi:hypothetical protein
MIAEGAGVLEDSQSWNHWLVLGVGGLSLLLYQSTSIAIPGSCTVCDNHFYASASLGASRAQLSQNTPTITYDDGLLKDAYPLNNTHDTTAMLSINGGYQFAISGLDPLIAVGMGLYHNPAAYAFKGQVVETASGDSSFTLHNYRYRFYTTRLMAEMQLTWETGRWLPFINAGLGPAWNTVTDYTESPVDTSGYVPLSNFGSRTEMQFAFQLGLGIGMVFDQEQIALGYRYVNAGSAGLSSRGPTYPYTLNTGTLSNNEVYISLTHVF